MKQGKDHLIFALDVPSAEQARELCDMLKVSVGMFKIGLELFVRSGPDLVKWIRDHTGVGVFLDLKLHDIPETVKRTMQAIADLNVALATVHCGENPSMMEAAVAGGQGKVGILGVTVLTSVDASHLRGAGYEQDLCADAGKLVLHKATMAQSAGCSGIVCSGLEAARIKERFGESFLAVTPGIRLPDPGAPDDDQRRVVTPGAAVSSGADFIVVGRPIRDAQDPAAAAQRIAQDIDMVL